uniref:Uncharacterized protein n=1 Tax=Candidatus Kentrum sp. LFY TaxID=2126342 RepID=A0A450UW32_9GAMM|nr:MAG: hypothetical protein BECKLFY1418A_GA0070994_106215 [Candidatus Kentron sp. LFY]
MKINPQWIAAIAISAVITLIVNTDIVKLTHLKLSELIEQVKEPSGITSSVLRSTDARGIITAPTESTTVGAEFEAQGAVTLQSNQIAWLAVRIGELYWPKEPAIISSGHWTRRIFEGGSQGEKLLVLLIVDKTTNRQIENWFESSRRTGSFPGMRLGGITTTAAEIRFTLR